MDTFKGKRMGQTVVSDKSFDNGLYYTGNHIQRNYIVILNFNMPSDLKTKGVLVKM